MKTTHSFSIDFIIRRCKNNKKEALIYARITVDEERKEISLKERINATDWDSEKEIVKGRTESVKSLNQHIEDVSIQDQREIPGLERQGSSCHRRDSKTGLPGHARPVKRPQAHRTLRLLSQNMEAQAKAWRLQECCHYHPICKKISQQRIPRRRHLPLAAQHGARHRLRALRTQQSHKSPRSLRRQWPRQTYRAFQAYRQLGR